MAPRDSGGNYTLPEGYEAIAGDVIRPDQHNPPLEDIKDALTGSLPRNGSAPMTGNLAMGAKKITGLADGTASGDATNLGQVTQAIADAVAFHVRVRAASVSNVDYVNDLQEGSVLDGVTLAAGDLVLLKNQSSAALNGIRLVPASGAAQRAPGYTTYDSMSSLIVVTDEGDTNADTLWLGTAEAGGVINSDPLLFEFMVQPMSVDVSSVSGGADTRVLYNNNGKLGEYAVSGTGSVAMTENPGIEVVSEGSLIGRTLQERFADLANVYDYEAVGDGVADDRSAISAAATAAASQNSLVTLTKGVYNLGSTLAVGVPVLLLGGELTGSQLFTAGTFGITGRQWFSRTDRGAGLYTDTPTVYTVVSALAGTRHIHNVATGYQQSVASDGGGRTNIPGYYMLGTHSGYGDVTGYYASFGISKHATAGDATSWTGRNSITIAGGEGGANTDLVNLYGWECALGDNTFNDVAALGFVLNFNRKGSNTAGYTSPWLGFRVQGPLSTQAMDAAFQACNSWKVGLDFTGATFVTNQAAIALKVSQRIYFNADATAATTSWFAGDGGTSLGTTYLHYNSNALQAVVGGVAALQVFSSTVAMTVPLFFTGNNQIRTGTTAGNSLSLQAYDVDGAAYVTFGALTANNTPTFNLASDVTIDAKNILRGTITGTAGEISVANGTGAAGDPTISLPSTLTFTGKTINGGTFTPEALSITSATAFAPQLVLRNNTNDANGPYQLLRKARGASGAGAAVQVNDTLGTFLFSGLDSAGAAQNGAYISALVTAVSSGSVSAKLRIVSGSSILEWDAGVLKLPSAGAIQINSQQVIGARKTGWATATGTATRTTFDTSSVTLPQLAERVKALIDDLHATAGHGVIGA